MKDKNPEKVKCALVLGKSGKYNDEFLMLSKDNSVKTKIKLDSIDKIAQYPRDSTWEFGTREGKTYRFRAQTEEENREWFDAIDAYVNKREPATSRSNTSSRTTSSTTNNNSNNQRVASPQLNSANTNNEVVPRKLKNLFIWFYYFFF